MIEGASFARPPHKNTRQKREGGKEGRELNDSILGSNSQPVTRVSRSICCKLGIRRPNFFSFNHVESSGSSFVGWEEPDAFALVLSFVWE